MAVRALLGLERLRLTQVKCYYSGTWSWVKPLTIPESPPIDLYNTCPVQGLTSLCAICAPLSMFFHTEVVLKNIIRMFDNSRTNKKKIDHPQTHPRATHMRVLHHAMHMRKHVMPCGRASAHTTRCRTHRSSLARSTVRQAKATPNVSVASNQQQRACTRARARARAQLCGDGGSDGGGEGGGEGRR